MSKASESRLLDKGLEIANKLQNEALFADKGLQKNLYAFLTVAELLNRQEDILWAKREIFAGFPKKEIPYYRSVTTKLWQSNKLVKFKDGSNFLEYPLSVSSSQLVHLLNDKKNILEYSPTPEQIKELQENTNEILTDDVQIIFTKTKIQEVLAGAKMEMLTKLNSMINEITYGKIPRGIFNKFQDIVNLKLAESNTSAVSALNIAVESLGHSEDPERISTVAHSCKRLIKSVADNLFPSQKKKHKMKGGETIEVGEEKYFNRLIAFVDKVDSKNRKGLMGKIHLLKNLYGEIPESMNKGTHKNISNQSAEMLVIYSYIVLGEIILEEENIFE